MKFKWILKYKQAFSDLKCYFITTLVFAYFDSDFKYVVETDLSDYMLKGVLSQYNKNGELYLVAFFFFFFLKTCSC
jgi:hypothetical protein